MVEVHPLVHPAELDIADHVVDGLRHRRVGGSTSGARPAPPLSRYDPYGSTEAIVTLAERPLGRVYDTVSFGPWPVTAWPSGDCGE